MKIKVLGKALALLELAAVKKRPVELKELAGELGISLPAASRIASDLVEAGLLRKSGYRSFETALGLIRLGQLATLNAVMPGKLNKLLASRCRKTGLQGALAGVCKGKLVYLYNDDSEAAGGRLGLPYVNHAFNSNIALAALGRSLGREKALEILLESLREHGGPDFPLKRMLASYEERLALLEEKGYSLLDGGSYWNACVPLRWRSETLGLALYGSPARARSKERLAREAQALAAEIEELLLNCG